MAANLQRRGLANFGKHIAGQLRSRRAVHVSSIYDKDLDEHVRPAVVPDNVIPPLPETYWAPHPETGVFSPTNNHKLAAAASGGGNTKAAGSALEERAFFRPLEDLDKPIQP